MNFFCASFERSDEYRSFILRHENAVKTGKGAWIDAAKEGAEIIPYSESCPEDEPNHDPLFYLEFVDDENNIYVDFFDRDTREWVESYKFYDDDLAWTISVDKEAANWFKLMKSEKGGGLL